MREPERGYWEETGGFSPAQGLARPLSGPSVPLEELEAQIVRHCTEGIGRLIRSLDESSQDSASELPWLVSAAAEGW